MLIRIVRMEFEPEKVEDFLQLFQDVYSTIASQPGCKEVKLLRDAQLHHVYYTYSIWESENHLELYRASAFFQSTWKKTKALFHQPARAYSLVRV